LVHPCSSSSSSPAAVERSVASVVQFLSARIPPLSLPWLRAGEHGGTSKHRNHHHQEEEEEEEEGQRQVRGKKIQR
jgi:hypothetical protein